MLIYEYEESNADPRTPHNSGKYLTAEVLAAIGVEAHIRITQTTVDALAIERGYSNWDEVTISREKMGDQYEPKLAIFFEEHLHEDEEIRFILDGAGYFDVRGADDRWIRIKVEGGDLVVLPSGIWHRFVVDEGDYIRAMRLFKDGPKWTPLTRSAGMDENKARQEYVKDVAEGRFPASAITTM